MDSSKYNLFFKNKPFSLDKNWSIPYNERKENGGIDYESYSSG